MLKNLMAAGLALSAAYGLFATAANAKNTYGIGIEGFHDEYKEPDLDLTDKTDYGSLTAYYSHQFPQRVFFAFDGRASYGKDDYSSPSGTLSGVPQYEFELRARAGYTFPALGGDLSPYLGIGGRYFLDEGKGYVSSIGAQAYDRRILQLYVPIGASLGYTLGDDWSITPQAEADIMFLGNVDSRLTNVVNPTIQFLDPAYNTQHRGIGLRGELMVGKTLGNYNFQIGPFVRYWWIDKSDTITYFDQNGNPALDVQEPKNNRLQVGAALRMLF